MYNSFRQLTETRAVIREIEESDRNWDPSSRRRKDRKLAENKATTPLTVQNEAKTDARSELTNPVAARTNMPRGFY